MSVLPALRLTSSVKDLRSDDYRVELRDGEGPALSREEFANSLQAVTLMLKHSDIDT